MITIKDTRSQGLLEEVMASLNSQLLLGDPRFRLLMESEWGRGLDLLRSLRAYLDALRDVRRAATALYIHPNTLRHRIRRATEISGNKLDDPATRPVLELQLRMHGRA